MSLWYVGDSFATKSDAHIGVYDTDDCTLEYVSCRWALYAGFEIGGIYCRFGNGSRGTVLKGGEDIHSVHGTYRELYGTDFVVWNDIATMNKTGTVYEICTVDGRYYHVVVDIAGLYVNNKIIARQSIIHYVLLLNDGIWAFHYGTKVCRIDIVDTDRYMNIEVFRKRLLIGGS